MKSKQTSRRSVAGGFTCSHCRMLVVINDYMGTNNRNHCNLCLWSKHVDIKPGDRQADCHGGMKPIGLTFRIEDRYRRGELMLIHACSSCPKISINRLAADDYEHEIVAIFEASIKHKSSINSSNIYVANDSDREEIHASLFGR